MKKTAKSKKAEEKQLHKKDLRFFVSAINTALIKHSLTLETIKMKILSMIYMYILWRSTQEQKIAEICFNKEKSGEKKTKIMILQEYKKKRGRNCSQVKECELLKVFQRI